MKLRAGLRFVYFFVCVFVAHVDSEKITLFLYIICSNGGRKRWAVSRFSARSQFLAFFESLSLLFVACRVAGEILSEERKMVSSHRLFTSRQRSS